MLQGCEEHWAAMKKAVQDRGMWHLVARNGEEAAQDVVEQIQGTDSIENWDPLMAAYWNISGKVLKKMGPGPMFGDEPFCPLCAVKESYEFVKDTPQFNPDLHMSDQWWIDSCMDAMLAYAREKSLIPGVQ